ncbi:aminotransferase [Desulforamulus aeronauticus]|uniref:Taurine-pyruvate aminotransferase n=1 Tax=Desulforamulus aeronauticus DSM 10349 TaxID=1121421 RepID=A0A1M6UF47_9FIRM|nr:aminotransferase [Desulforamulus aeronauticus]SHK67763.1 taurine-pyruvate aminotransferase [Desulforamulus aeronauticus DSM 10349]
MSYGYDLTPEELVEKDRQNLWHHLTQHKIFDSTEPTIIVEGKGCIIKDARGREFLDCVSGGVWCVNVGYGQESIAKAVYEQLKKMPYYALSAGNPPAIKLAEKLVSLLPGTAKSYISNSGSEANEKAFKMSRQYFRLKYPNKDKYKIIYRHRDYHGTTFAALSATGQDERRMGFEPLVPGFVGIPAAYCYRCSFGKSYPGCNMECARALEDVILSEGPDTVAAFIVEPITAGGGILVPQAEYFQVIQEICQKYEVLLILDEVVCGFGRTGKWFGHQHFDVSPDMITMAKGMASSYMPISATVCKPHIFEQFINDPADTFAYFRDISTYGGSAGSCTAALENIKIIEEQNLVERVKEMGNYLLESLKELAGFPVVGEIRGKGLFAGIELVEDRSTKVPVSEAYMGKLLSIIASQGVLVGRMNRSVPGFNNVVTMAPMYIVSKEELDRMVGAIKKALETVQR